MNIFSYLKRSMQVLFSKDVVFDINGLVLTQTADKLFELNGLLFDEVRAFCKQQGHVVEKVVFVTCFDSPVAEDVEEPINMKSISDAKLSIVKDEDGLNVARVLMGTHIEVKEI